MNDTTRYDKLELVLGGTDRRSEQQRLADRLRLILETEPGTLPYAPAFGCDLSGIVGGTASKRRLSDARKRIVSAMERWLPGASIKTCTVQLVETEAHTARHVGVPRAEAALASRAVSGVLEIRIELETPGGPVQLEALLEP